MSLNAKNAAGGDFKSIPAMEAGTYPARLLSVIDMGMQPQRPYQGQDKPPRQDIQTVYQFLDEFMFDEDGNEQTDKPRQQFETFALHNIDSDMAKSTKRYNSLDPDMKHGGDWTKLTNTPCFVTINQSEGKNGKVYNNVTAVSGMRAKDADKAPELQGEPVIFEIDNWNDDVFETLPAYIKEKINNRLDDKAEEDGDDWTK